MSNLPLHQIFNLETIKKNITGYSTQIKTPFGQVVTVNTDSTSQNRPFKLIEDIIQNNVKPAIGSTHTDTGMIGQFSQQLLEYSQNSLFKQFNVSQNEYFVVQTGNLGVGGSLTKIINMLKLKEIIKKEIDYQKPNERKQRQKMTIVQKPYQNKITGQLEVTVKKATLKQDPLEEYGLLPYVVVAINKDNKEISDLSPFVQQDINTIQNKTSICQDGDVQPVWNEKMNFDNLSSEIQELTVELRITDIVDQQETPQVDEVLGGCAFKIQQYLTQQENKQNLKQTIYIGGEDAGTLELNIVWKPFNDNNTQQQNYKETNKIQTVSLDKTNPKIPIVYVTEYEQYQNILPWHISGCRIQKINTDKFGNPDSQNLEKLLNEQSYAEIQIISLSLTSSITTHYIDMNNILNVIKNFKNSIKGNPNKNCYLIFDGSNFLPHNRVYPNTPGFENVDFFICSSEKILGGSEGSCILFGKIQNLQKYTRNDTLSLVSDADIHHILYETDPFTIQMPESPNVIGLYRASLSFELQEWIGLNYIKEREQNNATYFLNGINKLNQELKSTNKQIDILGDISKQQNNSVFSLNLKVPEGQYTIPEENSQKQILNPHYVAKLLNDIFGIQVRSGRQCPGPFGVKLVQIAQSSISQITQVLTHGFQGSKPGWLRLDTSFFLENYELDYILQSLKLIIKHYQNMNFYYKYNSNTIEFYNIHFEKPIFHFGINSQTYLKMEEVSLENRKQVLKDQIIKGESIITNPQKFIQKQAKKSSQTQTDIRKIQYENSIIQEILIDPVDANPRGNLDLKNLDLHESRNFGAVEKVEYFQIGQKNKTENKQNSILNSYNDPSNAAKLQGVLKNNNKNNGIAGGGAPSLVFSNNLNSREKRNKHLKEIFSHYSNDDRINITNFWNFCEDFDILGDHISKKELSELLRKVSFSIKGMTFEEFSVSLEELGRKLYRNDKDLITQFDRIEEFYINFLGIDDPQKYRQLLFAKRKQDQSSIYSGVTKGTGTKSRSPSRKSQHSKNLKTYNRDYSDSLSRQTDQTSRQSEQTFITNNLSKINSYKNKSGVPSEAQGYTKSNMGNNGSISEYKSIHKDQSMKRLDLKRQEVNWNSIGKISASDWNVAQKQQTFQPTDLFDIKEKDMYLAQYDLTQDLADKKKQQEEKKKQLDSYGEYKEKQRPTQKYLINQQKQQQQNQNQNQKQGIDNTDNRYLQMQKQQDKKQFDLLTFLETPASKRKLI